MRHALVIASAAPRWDRFGVLMSVICILHCLAMPLIVALLPLAAALEGQTHAALAAAIVLVGAAAFVPGYRSHRKAGVIALAAAGMSAIVSPVVFDGLELAELEQVLIVSGGVALIVAHAANVHFCRACPNCASEEGCGARTVSSAG